MVRSKKMQTRTRKVHKHKSKQGKRTRQRGGRMRPRNEAKNEANRKAAMEAMTEPVAGVIPLQNQGAVFNNGNNNNNNNNFNNNNNSYSWMNTDPDILRNEDLLYSLYSTLNISYDTEENRKKLRKALDKYFYALFFIGPKKYPGNTLESLTDSFIYEAQKYLGYTFDKENLPFQYVMEDLFKAYQHFKELEDGPIRDDFMQKQEELNADSINI